MSIPLNGERWLTELDHGRLYKLNGGRPPVPLIDLLDSAEVVPSCEVRPDVVTLYSQVLVRKNDTGELKKLTLCYPGDAEPQHGFISVLSPVGMALLGRMAGSQASWVTPTGQQQTLEIQDILFQPEATGDYIT